MTIILISLLRIVAGVSGATGAIFNYEAISLKMVKSSEIENFSLNLDGATAKEYHGMSLGLGPS